MTNERAAAMLREFLAAEILGRVARVAAPDRPELRASRVGSQIVGLLMARRVVGLPALAQADPELVAACVGPAIQRYLTGELPAP
jgi:hypothetical protein